MKKPAIGVVGCGYWGPNLARNFDANSECELKYVCDKDKERLDHMAKLYPQAIAEADFEKLLADPDLDAIVIAVPVALHFALAKASLEAGKHTLIEKPMASSSAECEELIAIAKEKNLTLMVGHTFLYSQPVREIKKIIQDGDIGELRYINCQRLNLGLFQKDINVAWDLAPHDISIILDIFGEVPLQINCQGNAHVTPGIEDVANISLNFRNNRFATIQSSWIEPRKIRQMTFVGSQRMIVYNDISQSEPVRIYDMRVERPPHYDNFAEFHYSYYYGDSCIPHIKQEEPLKTMAQHFLDCMESGEMPLTSGEQGMELVRILEASSESLKLGGGPVDYHANKNGKQGELIKVSSNGGSRSKGKAAPKREVVTG